MKNKNNKKQDDVKNKEPKKTYKEYDFDKFDVAWLQNRNHG